MVKTQRISSKIRKKMRCANSQLINKTAPEQLVKQMRKRKKTECKKSNVHIKGWGFISEVEGPQKKFPKTTTTTTKRINTIIKVGEDVKEILYTHITGVTTH